MSEQVPQLFKFLTSDMKSPIGTGEWAIGRRRSVQGELAPCSVGLHGWPVEGLLNFTAERLVRVEVGSEYVWHDSGSDRKLVAREMTPVELIEAYNDRTLRLFAADCAERVLPLFERKHPNDDRPRRAIETARRFANGEATSAELSAARSAAWDAAWDAAGDAAGSAAGSAAGAAVRAAARNAARDAAGAAARDAAGAAAWAAAWDAERQRQTAHLCQMLGIEVPS